jgi:FlaA1/EpsC-like NDP-sugar epimerase
MRRRIRSAAPSVHRFALVQLAVDGLLVALAYVLAYRLRFDGAVPLRYEDLRDATLIPLVAGALVVFALFGLYGKSWRYLTGGDYVQVVYAGAVATLVLPAYNALFQPVVRDLSIGSTVVGLPTSIIVLHGLLSLLLVGGVRFAVRRFYERPPRGFHARRGARAVLIVGAGDGGRLVLREILRNPGLGLRPVGFVDDDQRKRRNRVEGVRVLGTTDDLARILDEAEPDEVTIAIPSAPGVLRARVVRACRERGIPVRTLPTVFELLQTQGHLVRQAREVRVEDVLGREPVRMELDRGSIGSELCRQIARVGPRRLILLDHAEDNLFAIQSELADDRHVHPALLAAVLADCKEEERMREVFAEHRPTVVFHAAAYKHVGLMEANPVEAVRNNAIATRVVARVAGDASAKAFVLVSTDKAVAPATVMGASKALAEFAIEAEQARFPATRFNAVRFGNVLGSSGSVVPIFRRQIARGGPVTVTDARMTRYFMTIPESVQLIIRSGALGQGGEIFVLEMGEPVAIMDLARAMIELSGLVPDDDVTIEVTGRRPGEKLHEDLFNAYERPLATQADKIQQAGRATLDPRSVDAMFDEIGLLVLEGDAAALARKVSELSTLHRSVQEPAEASRGVRARERTV